MKDSEVFIESVHYSLCLDTHIVEARPDFGILITALICFYTYTQVGGVRSSDLELDGSGRPPANQGVGNMAVLYTGKYQARLHLNFHLRLVRL